MKLEDAWVIRHLSDRWWGADGVGPTVELLEAKIFTMDEALEIERLWPGKVNVAVQLSERLNNPHPSTVAALIRKMKDPTP